MKKVVLRCISIVLRVVECLVVVLAVCVCLVDFFTPEEDLEFAIERIQGLTGIVVNVDRAELILHKTNQSDSIIMVKDYRPVDNLMNQMNELVASDENWSAVQIMEENAYETICTFSGSMQTHQHFRPVCEIAGGCYDYMYLAYPNEKDIHGCLVDVDTGTIAMYIYLD